MNINAYAVNGRYPDDCIMPDADEAKHFYQLALDVNKMVKDRIVFD